LPDSFYGIWGVTSRGGEEASYSSSSTLVYNSLTGTFKTLAIFSSVMRLTDVVSLPHRALIVA